MPERHSFNYAIIRLVPHAEREEFLNVGVILCAQTPDFLDADFDLDQQRLSLFAPELNLDEVRGHLEAIRTICAGGEAAGALGKLSRRERFDWLVAPRSTIIRTSDVHTGLCEDPRAALNDLKMKMVSPKSINET